MKPNNNQTPVPANINFEISNSGGRSLIEGGDDGGNTWVMNSNFQGIKSGMRIYGISNNSGDI